MSTQDIMILEEAKTLDIKKCSSCGEEKSLSEFHKNQYICKSCKKVLNVQRYTNKKDHILEKNAAWRVANKDYMQTYYDANKLKWSSSRITWPSKNKNKLSRKTQTPQWANKDKIKSIYAVRDFLNEMTFGLNYHVDHIIPLCGKYVSGLHVENNLAVIPAKHNLIKGNSHG